MQYDLEITINLPRKRVIELFDSVENFYIEQDDNTNFCYKRNKSKRKAFILKVVIFLMTGAFKNQSFKYMTDFKTFADKA
ncbi:MAG: hypothetical protein CMP75_01280 [Flavobacteriales bacterium]|nr:hypothetical protein [Flavobacteriales bacterium]|tara:strand:+ start:584 stop:823 length:240 start_codon:yes stop_codon:yes gene_type:complete